MNPQLIFDTSVWVDFLHNKNTVETLLLTRYIEENNSVLLVPDIVQELLQGIRDDKQYEKVRDILSYFTVLQSPPLEAAIGAADLYRSIGKKGAIIRKSNDCLIAWYAIEFSVALVHADTDFEIISKYSGLKVWKSKT